MRHTSTPLRPHTHTHTAARVDCGVATRSGLPMNIWCVAGWPQTKFSQFPRGFLFGHRHALFVVSAVAKKVSTSIWQNREFNLHQFLNGLVERTRWNWHKLMEVHFAGRKLANKCIITQLQSGLLQAYAEYSIQLIIHRLKKGQVKNHGNFECFFIYICVKYIYMKILKILFGI